MKIYADTSFLVSLLYPGDPKHGAVVAFFAQRQGDDWLTTEWSAFETLNTLRQLSMAPPGAKPQAIEAIRRLFKHWHRHGPFQREEVDMSVALAEAHQLSAAHGNSRRMRSADVLHVALMGELNPDLFVTRDKDQYALAVAAGVNAQLVP